MKAERIDAVWMEDHYLLSIDELDDRWGLSRSQLQEFIAHGVLEPIGDRPGEDRFNLAAVSMVRTACRLQHELELDTHAVGVVLGLLQRVRSLEQELSALKAQLPAAPDGSDGPGAEPPEAEVIQAGR